MEQEAPRKVKKKKRFRLGRWALAAFLLFSCFSMGRQFLTVVQQHRSLGELEAQLDVQTRENTYLQKQIENAHTATNVSRLAREKLNMVWEGEIVYEALQP